MSTLVSTDAKSQRAFVPTTALAKSVDFDEEMMHVTLTDGRRISAPIIWFPLLVKATPDQRNKYDIGGDLPSLHSPPPAEHVSVNPKNGAPDWRATKPCTRSASSITGVTRRCL